jgi:hypothetical protein
MRANLITINIMELDSIVLIIRVLIKVNFIMEKEMG